MLAQRISSINSITPLTEKFESCSTTEVQDIVKADKRIGDKYLSPSPGFGGSCFEKDLWSFVYILDQNGEHEAAEYWNGVVKINQYQKKRLANLVANDLKKENTIGTGTPNPTVMKVAIMGFAYKKNTADTRMS